MQWPLPIWCTYTTYSPINQSWRWGGCKGCKCVNSLIYRDFTALLILFCALSDHKWSQEKYLTFLLLLGLDVSQGNIWWYRLYVSRSDFFPQTAISVASIFLLEIRWPAHCKCYPFSFACLSSVSLPVFSPSVLGFSPMSCVFISNFWFSSWSV